MGEPFRFPHESVPRFLPRSSRFARCARGGNRTHTTLRSRDFKSLTATNYVTRASMRIARNSNFCRRKNLSGHRLAIARSSRYCFGVRFSRASRAGGLLVEATGRIELPHRDFADLRITTFLRGQIY